MLQSDLTHLVSKASQLKIQKKSAGEGTANTSGRAGSNARPFFPHTPKQ